MSNFAPDINPYQQALMDQERHYGINKGGRPDEPVTSRWHREMPSSSNMVPNGSRDKPLPSVPQFEEPRPSRPQQPASGRYIYTNGTGRYDAQTIVQTRNKQQDKKTKPKLAPYQSDVPLYGPSTTTKKAPRRDSGDSWTWRGHKRGGSGASADSRVSKASGAGSRNSLKQFVKGVKDTWKIAGMSETQRAKHDSQVRRLEEHNLEKERRNNPNMRHPAEQRDYIVKRYTGDLANFDISKTNTTMTDSLYDAMTANRDFKLRDAQARYAHRVQDAHAHGESTPSPPSSLGRVSPSMSISGAERDFIYEHTGVRDAEVEMKARPKYIGGFAGNISKALDPFKRDRKPSDSSSMDFGMTDRAPADALNRCGSVPGPNYGQGCGQLPKQYLNKGLCEGCHIEKKFNIHGTNSSDETLIPPRPPPHHMKPTVRGHNPISPEDDAAATSTGDNLYIRLPTQQKLRRVRDTMYEDPGNPFSITPDSPQTVLPPPRDSGFYFDDDYLDSNPGPWNTVMDNEETWNHNKNGSLAVPTPNEEHLSYLSDPFDLASIADATPDATRSSSLDSDQIILHAPVPLRRATPTLVRNTRRSMSVDIGFLPPSTYMADGESSWRERPEQRRSLSEDDAAYRFHYSSASGTAFTAGAAGDPRRDSEFYRFYDEVLAEYAS